MIVNRQRRIRVPARSLERFTREAMALLRLPSDSLTVCFVTDGVMARWNRTYRGKDRPTDVLSFASDESGFRKKTNGSRNGAQAASAAAYLGDIAIAPVVARANALRFGRTLEDEMRILILHGILHLMGYDHETDTGQMERRERRLRRALGLA
jgi:probable rRNA maturation factor